MTAVCPPGSSGVGELVGGVVASSNFVARMHRRESLARGDLGAELEIDVASLTITLPGDRKIDFSLDKFARYCLVEGLDQMGFLQKHRDAIEAFEQERAWTP